MGRKDNISIPQPRVDARQKLVFSFEFYDLSGKYCLSNFKQEDILLAIERLKQLNSKTLPELFRDKKVLHFHEVDWSRTAEKKGFPNHVVNQMSPFQFSLNGINNQKARVYGAYNNEVFYIVWFDFNHCVWPSYLKHT